MSAIPSVMIAPLQAALQSQGFPATTIRPDGTLNPAGLLAGLYSDIEFRSSATPSIHMRTAELGQGGTPNPFLAWLRPTVILRGAGGETVIAPVGVSEGGSILPGALVVVGLVGLGVLIGKNI